MEDNRNPQTTDNETPIGRLRNRDSRRELAKGKSFIPKKTSGPCLVSVSHSEGDASSESDALSLYEPLPNDSDDELMKRLDSN